MMRGQKNKGEGLKTTFNSVFTNHRLSALLTLLLILLIIFLQMVRNTPEGQRWLASRRAAWIAYQAHKEFQKALAQDPPINFSLAQLGNLEFVIKPQFQDWRSKPLLLIIFGGCEGCAVEVANEWAEVLGNWGTWRKELLSVLVFREKSEQVEEAAEEGKWKVAVVADEDGEISKRLNAVFTPRAYGFMDGKMVWLQKEPNIGIVGVLENFLKAVGGEERAKALINAWSAEMREKEWGKITAIHVKRGDKR